MLKNLYMAYGSNLNHQQMAERCPKASYMGSAILKGWRLIFKSVATIKKEIGSDVPVGIFEISDQCEKALDVYEDYPQLYSKHKLDVNLKGKVVTAMTYIMVANLSLIHISEPTRPY